MIEIGYTTTSGDDTVTGTYDSPAEANEAAASLNNALLSRQDVVTLFLQSDNGSGMHKYGFIDPLEA